MISALWGQIGLYVAGAITLIGVWFANNKRQQNKGRDDAERKMKDIDNENAQDIRDRIDNDLPGRVHDFDDAGFRD